MIEFHKYSGAGNDFVVLDGRTEDVSAFRNPASIAAACEHYRTDGLMILTDDPDYDFRMEYYNSDGSGGMMCGNGGRCIVAFADALGFKPADGRRFYFVAPDGGHTGEIIAREGDRKTVRLRMIDVHEFHPVLDGWFLDTGTRHFVRFVPDAEAVDVETEGRRLRWDPAFAPVGANANFVSVDPDGTLRVRTFEKGVEGETLACGTGITASAIAAWLGRNVSPSLPGSRSLQASGVAGSLPLASEAGPSLLRSREWLRSGEAAAESATATFRYEIQARIAKLAVDFRPLPDGSGFTDVYLTGPAEEEKIA